MKNTIKFGVVAVGAMLAATGAHAASATGNLNVTTTVSVVCSAPSPSGNLVLPFSASLPLDGQAVTSTAVTVNVSCDGAPTVNYVDFDLGTHRGSVTSAEADVRYMRVSGGDNTEATDVLGYKLYAAADSATFEAGAGNLVGTDTGENENRLTIDETGSATFYVKGQVFEDARGAFADAGAVPSGTYQDTVVMTVDYGAAS